jgi:deoxyribodipyrimidine photolyase
MSIILFILTRDFRTSDALTLYQAYDESKKSNTKLSIIFRFHPDQISPKKNPYYSETAVEFMIQGLERLKRDLPFEWIEPISDDEWKKYLTSYIFKNINKISYNNYMIFSIIIFLLNLYLISSYILDM